MAMMRTAQTRFMVLAGGMALLLVVTLHLWAGGAKAAPQTCRKGFFPASGQTQQFTADLNDGISGPVPVPDDGAIQAGTSLSYVDNGDGTITDLNTGLMWEKKDLAGGLHDVSTPYFWSGDGTQETIWDWLKDVNAEAGGIGFAGHNDWRIPNVRELSSIVDHGRANPSAASAFTSNCSANCTVLTCSCAGLFPYWSSTTAATGSLLAWQVDLVRGIAGRAPKDGIGGIVRAVRGGCVD
jgi:Protein of unknown function (DUF1566)